MNLRVVSTFFFNQKETCWLEESTWHTHEKQISILTLTIFWDALCLFFLLDPNLVSFPLNAYNKRLFCAHLNFSLIRKFIWSRHIISRALDSRPQSCWLQVRDLHLMKCGALSNPLRSGGDCTFSVEDFFPLAAAADIHTM